jgi:hypothetical protein
MRLMAEVLKSGKYALVLGRMMEVTASMRQRFVSE